MSEVQKKFFMLAKALLDTDEGLSELQYDALLELAFALKIASEDWKDEDWTAISRRVEATDGRFYLKGGEG